MKTNNSDVERNSMTIKELSAVRRIESEIKSNKKRLKRLEAEAASTVTTLSPAPGGSSGRSDKVGNNAAEIADLQLVIRQSIQRCYREKARLIKIIENAPDSQLREVITKYYIDCKSWARIAAEIDGKNTPDALRKRCQRYLEKQPY